MTRVLISAIIKQLDAIELSKMSRRRSFTRMCLRPTRVGISFKTSRRIKRRAVRVRKTCCSIERQTSTNNSWITSAQLSSEARKASNPDISNNPRKIGRSRRCSVHSISTDIYVIHGAKYR